RQAMGFEQTIPRMNVDFAPGGPVQQPFVIGGWALDENVFSAPLRSDPGVDLLHVWAYPAGGGAPLFVGPAGTGLSRPDVGALFGPIIGFKYQMSGFQIVVTNLPSGAY